MLNLVIQVPMVLSKTVAEKGKFLCNYTHNSWTRLAIGNSQSLTQSIFITEMISKPNSCQKLERKQLVVAKHDPTIQQSSNICSPHLVETYSASWLIHTFIEISTMHNSKEVLSMLQEQPKTMQSAIAECMQLFINAFQQVYKSDLVGVHVRCTILTIHMPARYCISIELVIASYSHKSSWPRVTGREQS